MTKKKIFKWTAGVVVVGAIAVLALLLICNAIVTNNADGSIYTCVDSVPQHEVGLLLGTTPKTRIGRKDNQFFKYRIEAAEELYKAGRVKTILISGSDHSMDGINEVECMRDSLIARGLPDSCFVLDGKGFRTEASVINATKKYGCRSYVVISQKFHNERALYLASHMSLGTHDVVGYNAKDATDNLAFITYLREYLARVKMFIDLLRK